MKSDGKTKIPVLKKNSSSGSDANGSKKPNNINHSLSNLKAVKAKEYRKNKIFAIVDNYQKSRQMIEMVIALDELKRFYETNATLEQKEIYEAWASIEKILEIRSLIISLDYLNSINFNARMFQHDH